MTCIKVAHWLVSGSKYRYHSVPLRYNLHQKQTGGGLAHVHDPDSVLKSGGWVSAPSLSSCFRVILITHLWWVPSEVDEADGSFDMSLCPMVSIWLRLSTVSLSDPNVIQGDVKVMSKLGLILEGLYEACSLKISLMTAN